MTLLQIDTDDFLRAISAAHVTDPDAVEAFKQRRAEWLADDSWRLADAPAACGAFMVQARQDEFIAGIDLSGFQLEDME